MFKFNSKSIVGILNISAWGFSIKYMILIEPIQSNKAKSLSIRIVRILFQIIARFAPNKPSAHFHLSNLNVNRIPLHLYGLRK